MGITGIKKRECSQNNENYKNEKFWEYSKHNGTCSDE